MTTSIVSGARARTPRKPLDLASLVTRLLASSGEAELLGGVSRGLREAAEADPLGTLATTVAAASTVFYLAERGKNPKVKSLHDAFVLITTSLSVGFTDILPRTKMGKMVTSLVMCVGPALSSRALDPPDGRPEEKAMRELVASQRALNTKLERLVRALEKQRA